MSAIRVGKVITKAGKEEEAKKYTGTQPWKYTTTKITRKQGKQEHRTQVHNNSTTPNGVLTWLFYNQIKKGPLQIQSVWSVYVCSSVLLEYMKVQQERTDAMLRQFDQLRVSVEKVVDTCEYTLMYTNVNFIYINIQYGCTLLNIWHLFMKMIIMIFMMPLLHRVYKFTHHFSFWILLYCIVHLKCTWYWTIHSCCSAVTI